MGHRASCAGSKYTKSAESDFSVVLYTSLQVLLSMCFSTTLCTNLLRVYTNDVYACLQVYLCMGFFAN